MVESGGRECFGRPVAVGRLHEVTIIGDGVADQHQCREPLRSGLDGGARDRGQRRRRGYLAGEVHPAAGFGPLAGIDADKQDAHARKGIFMIDASKDFMRDGPKNRLRAQDIHRIVDVFNKQQDVPKYSRMVGVEEIEKKNGFNLNLPTGAQQMSWSDPSKIVVAKPKFKVVGGGK